MTKSDIMLLAGNNLRKCRIERALTQEAVAVKANISVSHYAALENGRKSMSMFVLTQLADAFEVSTDSILRTPDTLCPQIMNINLLLSNQPVEIIGSIEKLIRLCINEFSTKQKE